jgi:hypothetical protein
VDGGGDAYHFLAGLIAVEYRRRNKIRSGEVVEVVVRSDRRGHSRRQPLAGFVRKRDLLFDNRLDRGQMD